MKNSKNIYETGGCIEIIIDIVYKIFYNEAINQ